MYGSDAGQPVPSLYTKGLSPLCDTRVSAVYKTATIQTPALGVKSENHGRGSRGSGDHLTAGKNV